jgi:hypothetical protein
MNGGMGLTSDGSVAKVAFDAITSTDVFDGVPLGGQMVDVFTLLCFYELTEGSTTWLNRQGWGATPNPCDWYGVGCNGEGRVTKLALPDNGIRGGFPQDVSNIKDQLSHLDLSGNTLMFDRSDLSWYSRLQHVNVSRANVYGDLQMLFGSQLAFPSLQVLDASANFLKGTIPSAAVWHSSGG